MTVSRRFFLAHPNKMDEAEARQTAEQLTLQMAEFANAASVLVVPGVTDYNLHFKRAGSWDAWIRQWAIGTETTGEPRYHAAIVIGPQEVRRATAQGVELMLAHNKLVVWWGPGQGFRQVYSLGKNTGSERWPARSLIFGLT